MDPADRAARDTGRLLADVIVDGVNLAAELKARGLGVGYAGRTKPLVPRLSD